MLFAELEALVQLQCNPVLLRLIVCRRTSEVHGRFELGASLAVRVLAVPRRRLRHAFPVCREFSAEPVTEVLLPLFH